MQTKKFVSIFLTSFLIIPITTLYSFAFSEPALESMKMIPFPTHGQSQTFTPVTITPIGGQHSAVLGTDGLYHLIYEIMLTNTWPISARLNRIEVFDSRNPKHVYASYWDHKPKEKSNDKLLLESLHTLKPEKASSTDIGPDVSRLFFIELTFKPREVPQTIMEHLYFTAKGKYPLNLGQSLDYSAGRISIAKTPLPVLGPPLVGNGWVDFDGCCDPNSHHRGAFVQVNGQSYDSQRFAIDYLRINEQHTLVHGDMTNVINYAAYGEPVLSVADGTVISVMNGLENTPIRKDGTLPDSTSKTVDWVGGNHVIIRVGHGLYAFYAHLKKDSIIVSKGQHVKKGMVIAKVGNSGQSMAPHLHFHLEDSPLFFAGNGLPYVIDHFYLTGRVDHNKLGKTYQDFIEGKWAIFFKKQVREPDRIPLHFDILNFPKN